jgi:hypothetical protein
MSEVFNNSLKIPRMVNHYAALIGHRPLRWDAANDLKLQELAGQVSFRLCHTPKYRAKRTDVKAIYLERNTRSFIAQLVKKFSAFIQLESSLSYSQKPATGSYTDPV